MWRRSRPKNLEKIKDIFERAAQKWPISGGVKIQDCGPPLRPKKVRLTAEKVGFGPKLAKISGGVKPGHLEVGRGQKMAKIQYEVKPDIFKCARLWTVARERGLRPSSAVMS